MNQPPTILKEWTGRGWWVRVVEDQEHPLRVNAASAAPDGQQAMKRQDARDFSEGLRKAVAFSLAHEHRAVLGGLS